MYHHKHEYEKTEKSPDHLGESFLFDDYMMNIIPTTSDTGCKLDVTDD